MEAFIQEAKCSNSRIWLFDLAKSLPPSTQLEGYDVSSAGFPPEDWLPDNIHLGVWNIFEEPPEFLVGRFDLVHIRLFLVVIDDNDPSPVLRNCLKILSTCTSNGNWQYTAFDRWV